jgi:hypothetical protein
MDPSSIAAAFVSSSAGQFQQAMGERMLAMNVDAGRSVVKMIDEAVQSTANLSPGIGGSVNMTA